MTLALDGSAASGAVGSPITFSLTTTQTNDIIYVFGFSNSILVTATIADTANLTWNSRYSFNASGNGWVNAWWAVAPSILSGDTITIVATGSTYSTYSGFAISGGNTSSPFDSNAAVPTTGSSGSLSGCATTATNTFMIGAFCLGGGGVAPGPDTSPATWNIVYNNNFVLTEYLVASSAQSSFTINADGFGAGGGTSGAIFDAIVPASASSPDDIATRTGAVEVVTLMRKRISGLFEPAREVLLPHPSPDFVY